MCEVGQTLVNECVDVLICPKCKAVICDEDDYVSHYKTSHINYGSTYPHESTLNLERRIAKDIVAMPEPRKNALMVRGWK